MLDLSKKQDIIGLFDKIIDAYIASASEVILTTADSRFDDEYEDDSEYKYEMSRIASIIEEWKKELSGILDGNEGRGNKVGS